MDRKSWWMAALAAVGLVVGVVALIIAIGAKNDTRSDADITAAVKREQRASVRDVRASLDRDVRRATVALRRLDASSAQADAARVRLRRTVGANQSAISSNRQSIANLQTTVKALQTDAATATTRLNRQSVQIQKLADRVKALEAANK